MRGHRGAGLGPATNVTFLGSNLDFESGYTRIPRKWSITLGSRRRKRLDGEEVDSQGL